MLRYINQKGWEIGTYTGYSALCFSEGIEVDGEIHTIDKNEELLRFKVIISRIVKQQLSNIAGDALDIIPQLMKLLT